MAIEDQKFGFGNPILSGEAQEGFIDVRFVLRRDDDLLANPQVIRVERMGYLLPKGTTSALMLRTINELYEDPHSLTEDVAEAFAETRAGAFISE